MSEKFEIQLVRDGVAYALAQHRGTEVMMDASAAIKRTLRGTLYGLPPEVDLLIDRLRVMHGLEPIGTFIAATAPRSISAAGAVSYEVEAYDLSYLLERSRVEKAADAYWPAGTKYTSAIESILVRCGIADWVITPSNAVLAVDRTDWEPGTSWLEIVNQLLSEMGYNSLWFDSFGTCRVEPHVASHLRPVSHDYSAGKGSIIVREHTIEDDTFDTPNVFTVLVDGPDQQQPIWAQAINDDPTSRLSVPRRGRVVAPVKKLDGIADQAAAQAYVDNLKWRSMASEEIAKIQTDPESGHEMLDIIATDLPELKGKWEEMAWTLPLSGALMSHTMRRTVYE